MKNSFLEIVLLTYYIWELCELYYVLAIFQNENGNVRERKYQRTNYYAVKINENFILQEILK